MKARILSILILSLLSCGALSAPVVLTEKITSITSNSTAGDVLFQTENLPTGCSGGYWLKKEDAGFKQNISFLLSAFHAGTKIKTAGYDDILWPGNPDAKYCLVPWLTLEK